MAGKVWCLEEIDYLKEHGPSKTCKSIADHLGRSERSVQHKFNTLGIQKFVAKVGDVVKGWKITEIYLKDVGNQKITMAKVKSTINDKVGKYRLTLLTNKTIGYPDRRRPDLSERNTTHGMSKSRLYSIWYGMKSRCYNEKQLSYQDYGGRGITICDEWKDSFINFKDWAMNNGYAEDLTLDREDVDGNYEPKNCRWSDWITQSYNRKNRKFYEEYTAFNETKSVYEWFHDERCVVSLPCLQYRISAGKDLEKALTVPTERKSNNFNHENFYKFIKNKYPELIEEYLEQA